MYPKTTGEAILAGVHFKCRLLHPFCCGRPPPSPNGTRHNAHSWHLGSRWREEAKAGGDFQEIGDHVQESRASQLASMIWLIVANSFPCLRSGRFRRGCNIQPAKTTQIVSRREKKKEKKQSRRRARLWQNSTRLWCSELVADGAAASVQPKSIDPYLGMKSDSALEKWMHQDQKGEAWMSKCAWTWGRGGGVMR